MPEVAVLQEELEVKRMVQVTMVVMVADITRTTVNYVVTAHCLAVSFARTSPTRPPTETAHRDPAAF